MKIRSTALVISLAIATPAQAGIWETIKGFFGGDTATKPASQPQEQFGQLGIASANIEELISQLTSGLDISLEQANGGMAALLNLAKSNLSSEQFSQLADALPGVESLLRYVPDVSQVKTQGLDSLLDKASEYSDSLGALSTVKKQFEALGLDSQMVSQFVTVAKQYLDSEDAQQAKQLLLEGLGKL